VDVVAVAFGETGCCLEAFPGECDHVGCILKEPGTGVVSVKFGDTECGSDGSAAWMELRILKKIERSVAKSVNV